MSAFREIFERAKNGDRDAMDALLRSQLAGLRAFVRLKSGRVLRERESCSDLVQTVCRSVLEKLEGADCSDERSFRNWLFTVAHRRILNRAEFHSAAKRDPARELRLNAGTAHDGDFSALLGAYGEFRSPSGNAATREEVERIEAAIDALPSEYREVLIRACIQGQAHEQIAGELERTREATRQLLSRARAKLAIELRAARRTSRSDTR